MDSRFAKGAGGVPVSSLPACSEVEMYFWSHVISDADCARLSASHEVSSIDPRLFLGSPRRVCPSFLGWSLQEGFGAVVGKSHLCQGASLRPVSPGLLFFSDASDEGWDAHMSNHFASGLWHQEVSLSLNLQELRAIRLGLESFTHHVCVARSWVCPATMPQLWLNSGISGRQDRFSRTKSLRIFSVERRRMVRTWVLSL